MLVVGVEDLMVVVVVVVVDFSVKTVSSDCLKTKIARKHMISITALEMSMSVNLKKPYVTQRITSGILNLLKNDFLFSVNLVTGFLRYSNVSGMLISL